MKRNLSWLFCNSFLLFIMEGVSSAECSYNDQQKSTALSSQCSQCGREPTDPGACTRLEGKHLQFISDRITNDWKQLVLAVGLKQYVIDQIEADYTTMAEKAYQGLTRCLQIDAMVSHCWLIELIQSMQRFDIIEELAQTYPELEWVSNSPCASDYTLQNTTELSMRQAEIEQIREFFKVEQTKHNILVIQGLPGVGTTESKIQAMNDLDQNKIIYPRFHQREKHEKKWTLNELMDVIFQSLRSTRYYIPSNKVHPSIDDILKSIKEPIYLNLEVSNLRMRKGVEFSLWNFLRGLLQRNNLLKIIITSYEYPHQLTLSNTFDIVRLTDFNLSDSVRFLQFHNQSLTEEHCRRIFQCCGGNPLMLKKISLNIQNLHQHKLEIDRFVRELRHNTVNMNWFDSFLGDTFWSNNMNVILEKMDDKSIVVLTKLVVFNDQIPTGSLETIYSDPMVAHEANHLFIHHTICEKIDNKNSRNYRMSTIYRSFLRNFIKNERRLYEHHEEQVALKEIIDDSHERVRQFFLDLLQELATMYNSKCFTNFTTRCENIINEYAGFCSCGDKGYCSSYKSSMAIFQSHELTFLNFIKEPIFPYFTKAFLSKPIEIIQFLRNVISKSELEELKQSQFQLKYVDGMDADRIGRSLAMATFVLLKVQTNQKGFDDINILSRCITTLRHCKDESHRAVLFMCYLNRAEAYAVVAHSRENAQEDILEAKKIYKIDKIKGARLIEYYNTLADIHYHFQEFDDSIKYRKLQRDESERSLGVHPLTAKAYYLLGKTQRTNCVCEDTTQCTGNANSAKAKEMFVKMKDELVALDPYLKEDFIVKWCERLGADKSWLFDVPLNSPTK